MEHKRRRQKNRDPSETNIKQTVMCNRCEKELPMSDRFHQPSACLVNVVCTAEPL